jgi:hypothetical protein
MLETNMSESQGQSFKTCRKPTTLEHSRVEMGKHLYGLHCGFASHLVWVQLNMGHHGPLDQVSSLHTRIHHLQGQTVCRALHITSGPLSWHAKNHHL